MNSSEKKEIVKYLNQQLDAGMQAAELRGHLKQAEIDAKLLDEVLDERARSKHKGKETKTKRPLLITLAGIASVVLSIFQILTLLLWVWYMLLPETTDMEKVISFIIIIGSVYWIIIWAAMSYGLLFMKKWVTKFVGSALAINLLHLLFLGGLIELTIINVILLIGPYLILWFYKENVEEPHIALQRQQLLEEMNEQK